MRPDTHQCREASDSSRLHPSGHHGNTFGHFLEFKKIPVFLCRHGLGRQPASIQKVGQHHQDEVLDKEITCRQFATILMLGQHRLDVALIRKL
jgi:hypothetical protein